MRTGASAAAAETRRSKVRRAALRAGVAGAIAAGASIWLPPSPPVALLGTAMMVPVFWGLLQVPPARGGRHLTWVCGGLVVVNTLFLAFIAVGAAFPGAFTVSRTVDLAVMALMVTLHLQQRARIQAALVVSALLAVLAGYGGIASVLKGLWLLALGMWLLQKARRQTDAPQTLREAINR